MMSAMQLYVYEIRQSSSTAERGYALNRLELYMLVLTQLGKTYWTADLQYNLFNEALKALNGNPSSINKDPGEPAQNYQNTQARNGVAEIDHAVDDIDPPSSTMMNGTLDDFLMSFNPFMGFQIPPNELR
jgi:hypothetical protein